MKRSALSLGQAVLLLALLALVLILQLHERPLVGKVLDTFNSVASNWTTSEAVSVTPTLHQTTVHDFDNPAQVTPRPSITNSPTPKVGPGLQHAANSDDFSSASLGPQATTLQVMQVNCSGRLADPASISKAEEYAQSVMNSTASDVPRLQCAPLNATRYSGFRTSPERRPRYFFAMNLHQSAHILPQLFGAIVEAVRVLGPELCAISVVEGRSTDGTFEILKSLVKEMEHLGVSYFLSCNELQPGGEGAERISALAELRNMALRPLTKRSELFDSSTAVIFLNDIAPCAEDILELILQRELLRADMTCGMDWYSLDDGEGGTFYDSWIGRQMNGETFFEVPQSTSWDFSKNLFWNHPSSKSRYANGQPFQVFSCWNGAAVISARPFMDRVLRFRTEVKGECHLGEPVHLAKDLWRLGYGRIAVIPSVNVAYSVEETRIAKVMHGSVSSVVEKESTQQNQIVWEEKPPCQIKCLEEEWHRPSWEPFDLHA